MTADLVLKERAAPHIVAGVACGDAARELDKGRTSLFHEPANDLTFVSIHTPRAVRLGRSCI